MPGVEGLSLVREYRRNLLTKDIPIIVLSTKEDPEVKSAAFDAGANDYVVKLHQDKLSEHADHAILVARKFPAGLGQLHVQDGVIVVNAARVIALTRASSNGALFSTIIETLDFVVKAHSGEILLD